MDLKKFYEQGFLILKNFFETTLVDEILADAQGIFRTQIEHYRLSKNGDDLEAQMVELFKQHPEVFFNCGKQCQHLWSLHQLSLSDQVRELLLRTGLTRPHVSTRPVLYFNNEATSPESLYWKVPPHQDWRSMQGSIDSVVLWLPLMDMSKEIGDLEFIPGSHQKGLWKDLNIVEGFGLIRDTIPDEKFVATGLKKGDALLFSSFLVHRSGRNVTNNFRWSCHFRYNNLDEKTFIERGYPHAYIYRPEEKLLTPEFDTESAVRDFTQSG